MKLLTSLLSFVMLLGCSGESTSSDKVAEEILSKVSVKEASNKESTMLGLFGKKETEKYVVSSPLEGMLVKDGLPLINSKIIRRLRWNGNDEGVVDEFKTDAKGYFSIPAREEFLSIGKLAQFVSNIELFSESETDNNFFWYSNKFSGELLSDFESPIKTLVCDINSSESRVELKHGAVYSKCRWNNLSGSKT